MRELGQVVGDDLVWQPIGTDPIDLVLPAVHPAASRCAIP
jgi:hypothetical protein